jgi:aminomethyltransferase
MCDPSGGIIDDLLVYHMGSHFMLVVNAGNIAGDAAWIREHAQGDVVISDVSDQTALIAVQGPSSRSLLERLTEADLSSLPYYRFMRATVAGVDLVLSRTGYTGELGFELYFPAIQSVAEGLWHTLLKAGADYAACPVGLGARDTLRLEMGFCLYGNDIDRTTHPLEAGLGWITKLDKGEFIGRDSLRRARETGLRRKLTAFVMKEKAVPRKGHEILAGGESAGHVTSGTFSPTLEQGIGMGYIASHAAQIGSRLQILIRGKEVPAEVVPLPFVNQEKH